MTARRQRPRSRLAQHIIADLQPIYNSSRSVSPRESRAQEWSRGHGYILHVAPGELGLERFCELADGGRDRSRRGEPRGGRKGAAGGVEVVARSGADRLRL